MKPARTVTVPAVAHGVSADISATWREPGREIDPESRRWLAELASDGGERGRAITRLHDVLLRAARFEVRRRWAASPYLRGGDAEDIAQQSADDALVAVLSKLDDYRGDSRFTTWAYKFALLEAAVKVRRRSWQEREVPLRPEAWPAAASQRPRPEDEAESAELLAAVRRAIDGRLTPHQREVLTALAVNGVPIDVLAERLGTTRGALYKTLHDARKKLRLELAREGFQVRGGSTP